MHLKSLSIRHFRNLGVQELELPPEGVALVGRNAQGKSNFLEAIYYLETLRSFRGSRDEQLIGFDEDVFRIVGELNDPVSLDEHEVTAAYQRRGRKKKVTRDGQEPARLTDGLGGLAAVIFSPADVAVVNEGPGERRRFLDIVLSLNVPGYVEGLQQYRHVLAQRNAALKDDQPQALVAVWDEPLVRSGAILMVARRKWVVERSDSFSGFYADVSGGQTAVQTYQPSVDLDEAPDEEAVRARFRSALESSRSKDRRMGTTTVGPHRDEVRFALDGERELDVRDYGSGGQRRTVALALRLVEAQTIRDARCQEPIVLMDDVFAELDQGRSERIMDLIDGGRAGQVILTAPKESDIRLRRDVLPRWSIDAGRISA